MAQGRMRGTLTTWHDERGFGFITTPSSTSNVFVHISAFAVGSARPELGDAVTFALEPGAKGVQAAGVRLTGLDAKSRSALGGSLDYLAVAAFLVVAILLWSIWAAPLGIFAIYGAVSFVTFLAYRADKRAAKVHTWRTPEASLLLLGLAGGWPGAVVAMRRYRHKISKTTFRVLFWASVLVNLIVLVFVTSPLFSTLIAAVIANLGL